MSGSGGVLSLFPSLSDRNVTKRVSSAKEFVSQLTNEEIAEEKKEKDIDYCIERFVKGLAANKGWSRPGFTLGLISVLSEIPEVKTKVVLEKMFNHLDEKKDKENIKGIVIGRAFCLAAIIKSGRANDDLEVSRTIVGELFRILKYRVYLNTLCVELIIELCKNSNVKESLRDEINEQLTRVGPQLTSDPDLALLLFNTKNTGLITDAQFRVFWGSSEIVDQKENLKNKKCFEKLKNILNGATKRHPKRHPVVDIIFEAAIEGDSFVDFWQHYEKDMQRLTWEKKYVVMDALNFCLPLVTRSDDMIPLLSGEAVRLTRNSLVSKERFLFKQGQEFVAILAQKVAKSDTELQRVIFATLIHFTPLTKSMCVAIIKNLNAENQLWFMKWWTDTWNNGKDTKFEINVGNSAETRKWLLQNLNMSIKGEKAFPSQCLFIAIKTLLTSEFFKVTKRSKKCTLPEFKVSGVDIGDEKTDLRFSLQNYINSDRLNLLEQTVAFVDLCLSQKGVELATPFDETTQITWDRMQSMSEKIKSNKFTKILTPLVWQCAIGIFTERNQEGILLLSDILNLVEENTFDDSSLVEILLSFLVSQSGKNRTLVTNCFRQMASDCTEAGLTVIAEAIDPTNKDGPLDIEDDEAGSDDEDESEDEDEDDREPEAKKQKVANDDEDESEEEDEVINGDEIDSLKQKLKEAMGDAAAGSGDEESEDDDMTDEQMMNIDDAIGNAFKSMGSNQRKERAAVDVQTQNFRLRVFDLVDVYLGRNAASQASIILLKPLLKTAKVRLQTSVSKKASKILLDSFCNAKKFCRQYDLDQVVDLMETIVQDLVKCYQPEYGIVCQNVTLFLLKTMRERILESEEISNRIGGIFKVLFHDFMTKNTSKVTIKFLTDLCQRYPNIMNMHLSDLVAFISSASNGFRKCISAELSIKLLSNEKYSSEVVNIINAARQEINPEKPKLSIKLEKQAEIVVSAIRYISKHEEELKTNDELKSILKSILESELASRNDVKNVTLNAIRKSGIESGLTQTKTDKDAARQSRRDAKRAKTESKKAKFEKIKQEKIDAGKWVEKSKWKQQEKKVLAKRQRKASESKAATIKANREEKKKAKQQAASAKSAEIESIKMENGDGEPAAKKSKGEVSESKKLKRDLEPSTENEMKKLKIETE